MDRSNSIIERRAAIGEIRVEGRKLTGVVMRYGEVSPSHKERFEPGALLAWTGRFTWTWATTASA